ncbi:hypothetical protein XENOCAPTIV_022115, partial [Xenoophorus captivus]
LTVSLMSQLRNGSDPLLRYPSPSRKHCHSMTVLLLYRLPNRTLHFSQKYMKYSLHFAQCYIHNIVNINIHVDNPSCQLTGDFLSLLDSPGLQQFVKVPTLTRGHILDLAIIDKASFNNMEVCDLSVSDHLVVSV